MKTTNLTPLEAIDAMRRGECVNETGCSPGYCPWCIKDGEIFEYRDGGWKPPLHRMSFSSKFYIVPDPSKPKQKCKYCGAELRSDVYCYYDTNSRPGLFCSTYCRNAAYPPKQKESNALWEQLSAALTSFYGHGNKATQEQIFYKSLANYILARVREERES